MVFFAHIEFELFEIFGKRPQRCDEVKKLMGLLQGPRLMAWTKKVQLKKWGKLNHSQLNHSQLNCEIDQEIEQTSVVNCYYHQLVLSETKWLEFDAMTECTLSWLSTKQFNPQTWFTMMPFHNGRNDYCIRQSQLWDQIICQTNTG